MHTDITTITIVTTETGRSAREIAELVAEMFGVDLAACETIPAESEDLYAEIYYHEDAGLQIEVSVPLEAPR